MKLVAVALGCITFGLMVMACNQQGAPTTNSATPQPTTANAPVKPVDEMATARQLYAQNCETCHGPTGEGGPVQVDGKSIKVPSLKADHAIKRTDERMVRLINNGDGPMPPFEDKLKPEEIASLVRFVRKEFQGK